MPGIFPRMLHAFLAVALAVAPAQDSTHLVIVSTTDVHGRVTAWDYAADRPAPGGLARAARVVDSLRRRHPGQVLLLDAGDLLQGDLLTAYVARFAPRSPHPVVDAMGLLGYDAAVVGNHEFDYGIPFLRRSLRGAAFAFLGANLHELPADTSFLPGHTTVHRGGLRVGIVGFTTPGVSVWNRAQVAGRVRATSVTEAARRLLPRVRAENDFAIALIHAGMDEPVYDGAGQEGSQNAASALARLPVPPDLVVVGHSHREMVDSVVNGVHFVQPRSHAQSLSVVHVDLLRRGGRWVPVRFRAESVNLAEVPPDPRITRRLEEVHAAVREWATTPLGIAGGPMPSALARAEPSAIVEFVNAVQRRRTGAELSATPAFDLRTGFAAGEIRVSHVATVYPYENTLRAVRITGALLRAYLEQSARYFAVLPDGRISVDPAIPGYNFDILSGASYVIDLRYPPGSRIRDLEARGRPVRDEDSFTLALNSYRLSGAGGYDMLRNLPVVYDRGESVLDLLLEEVRRLDHVDPGAFAEASWRIEPTAAREEVRALFGAPPLPRPARPEVRDTVLLRILGINDLHGALEPTTYGWSEGRPVGGMAALKGLMDSLERDCACPTLRLDAGDQLQGSLVSNLGRGRPMVDALNRLGIAAAALGNHEFDWSVDTLRQRQVEARYPWLAANVVDSATGMRPGWLEAWRMVRAGPYRIAVVGYLTPTTKRIVRPQVVAGLAFRAGAEALRETLAAVRRERPDMVVLVAHAGGACHGQSCGGEIFDLVRELGPGAVDVVVSGHTHTPIRAEVGGVPIVQAGSRGTAIAVVDLVRTPVGARELRPRLDTAYADLARPDSAMAALVARYVARSDSVARAVVATIKLPLPRTGSQYALGHLVADAFRNALRTDAALVNNGGIRAELLPGPVTYGRLFDVVPFQNRLVRVWLTGRELKALLELALAGEEPRAHLAGLRVRYDPEARPGRRVRDVRLASGRKVEDGRTYTLAVGDYLATGADGFEPLARLRAEPSSILDLDAFAAYLRRLPQPVAPPDDPRFLTR